MPKVPSSRRNRLLNSTAERRARAVRVEQESLEMDFRCKRCEEKNLRCFVETTTGRCAGCISVWADCSLFVSEEEWKQVQLERERKELEVAQAEERQALAAAEASRLRRELLQVKSRERAFARRDLAILDFQEKATQQAEGALPLAERDLLDPSFDCSFLFGDLIPAASDVLGGTPVPIPCSP
ncbi:hypothetical protein P3342_011084 [Pyrenophora teres f. teres]|nr:hypothetical protein P3342_011084 [Pyrenophora teres f. teres]